MWKAIKSPTVWIKEKKLVAGHTSIADSPLAGESNSGSSSCSCEVATFLALCSARICFIAYKPEFSFPVKKHRKYKDIDRQIRNFFNQDFTVQHQYMILQSERTKKKNIISSMRWKPAAKATKTLYKCFVMFCAFKRKTWQNHYWAFSSCHICSLLSVHVV